MKKYKIEISLVARLDIKNMVYGITHDLLNPDAAKRYHTGILEKIESLR
jgi:plasmid stabilization system protein ParE